MKISRVKRDFLPMNFRNLLDKLPFNKPKTVSEAFFALDIETHSVTAALWLLEGHNLRILNTASTQYTHQGELLDAANQVLDEALADFNFDPSKVLLGVPDFWLIDDNLKDEYLKILKHLTKELDLNAMAYVSTSHAMSHFLQKQTGVPTTAILVDYTDPLTITVVKAGKIIGSKSIKRSDDLGFDIEKGLMSFAEVEVLPSRMLVFSQSEMSGVKDKLVAFPWMSKLPFLHLPKIDLLDKQATIQAICFAGASEVNPDVVYRPDQQSHISHSTKPLNNDSNLAKAGFVAGDIENLPAPIDQQLPSDEFDYEAVPPRNLPSTSRQLPMVGGVMGLLRVPQQWWFNLTADSHQQGWLSPNRLALIIPAVVIVAVLAAYLLAVKAHVTVMIDAKRIENSADLTANPAITEVDDASRQIPGKVFEADVSETGRANATGKKLIGDPAKGTVIIYNKTDSSRSFSKGTVISSSGGIKFTLDTSVQVASKSSEIGPGFSEVIKPGKSEAVGITAEAIGPDGNLPGGTNLTVAGFDQNQVIAQVDTALSGGTSKEIAIVSADDHKKLLAQVASSLRQKAKGEVQAKLTGDYKIIEEGLLENITSQKFSRNVGDQATDFTLSLSINYKGTAYSEADLKTMVSKLVQVEIPEGYDLNLSDFETQATATRVDKDGKLLFNAKSVAKLIPQFDLEQMKSQIAGKTPDAADTEIKKIENVLGVDVQFSPKLPDQIQLIPFLTRNISIEVTAQ